MRWVDLNKTKDDNLLEKTLRPSSFDEFLGQDKVKKKLETFIKAALQRKESLDHVLLSGPPGLGKTSLAHLIALKMQASLKSVSGPSLKKKGDIAALLTGLKKNSVLFIDEIHRITKDTEEYLYTAMEDSYIDIMTGEGLGAKSMKFKLPHFTLIGATTRSGLLDKPFLDRFGIVENLNFYEKKDLILILKRSAKIMNLNLEEKAADELASRSRKTPRIANRLLKRVRDYAEVEKKKSLDLDFTSYALKELEVDSKGLDRLDRKILELLKQNETHFVGIQTIAAMLSENEDTLEEVYEPFLLREGFIEKTPKGRKITQKGKDHLDKEV